MVKNTKKILNVQEEDELIIKKVIISILLYITFRFGFAHLQHSNVSNLNAVCALYYKVYCAYTLSNGAMALLNKFSVFRIPLPCCCRKRAKDSALWW